MTMQRIRTWHVGLGAMAALVVACTLNPQPLPPDRGELADEPGSSGSTGPFTPPSDGGASDSDPNRGPDAGQEADASADGDAGDGGDGGDGGDAGDAGDSG